MSTGFALQFFIACSNPVWIRDTICKTKSEVGFLKIEFSIQSYNFDREQYFRISFKSVAWLIPISERFDAEEENKQILRGIHFKFYFFKNPQRFEKSE